MAASRAIQNFNGPQLAASSTSAERYGVPVYLLRGVTGFKYGAGATAPQFAYVAAQLSGWYTHFYRQTGDALATWQKAAAQEMGAGASAEDVGVATANISAARNAPAVSLGIGSIVSDIAGGIDAGIGAASGFDTAASDAAGTAGSGAVTEAPAADGGSAAADTAAGVAGKAAAGLGLAGLLGLSGISGLLVRALEALAGAALILLGLQALTGGDGNPASAVSKATGSVRRIVV